ncbi:hypothetical protein [Propionispora hippei]|uniref:Uncharacterized protein n=1 Tax=Propionispora hippei DSM 15287 TaxID=1123003 RepID=A0A1M6ACK1_9FIRM|nr:hypothetical protein [Propionispora hippei]SHI34141.1 hypothetical protein SAMN02745170_00110 [Propionispora hippei DSM 15287]
MSGKKAYILLFITAILLVGSVTAWFYFFDDLPKKVPVRSRQVQWYDAVAEQAFSVAPFDTYNIVSGVHTILAHSQ